MLNGINVSGDKFEATSFALHKVKNYQKNQKYKYKMNEFSVSGKIGYQKVIVLKKLIFKR